jgi:hypothetical protein
MTSIRTYADSVKDTMAVSQPQRIKNPVVLDKTTSIAAATELKLSQSGTKFLVAQTGSAYAITLPPVASATGVGYSFVITSASVAGAIAITARSAVINGVMRDGADASTPANVIVTAATAVTITASQPAGSYLNIWSDGSKWYCSGHSKKATGFTAA